VTHAERTGVAESTEFTGWLELDEAMGRVADADIALVPHVRSAHTDATVPHKLFQYMALGRPVVVSDCGPLARIVDETGAGRVFASGDAASLAAAVLELTDDDVAHAAGEAGRRAVRERWNIERDVPALLAAYDGSVSPRDGDATTGPA
jgi:glycosyltransferase involved in cell wall biosynthesis